MEHQLIPIENCPICQSTHNKLWRKGIDHNVSNDTFSIVQCEDCGFRFTNPRPTENTIGDYYKSSNYVSHSGTKKGVINKIYHAVRKKAIVQKELLIQNHNTTQGKKLVDIGCGTGDFLAYCKTKNWDVLGLEPDSDARSIALKNNVMAHPLDHIKSIENESIDVITMWHVLEHVYHLNDDIKEFKRILKPNGTLMIAVPNCSSHDADHYKEHWAALDLPIHLYHFQPKNIEDLFSRHNMKLEKILPMKYDAYYISMISERYKGGNILSGFWRGYISNRKAKKVKNTFSSQIYVLKK